VIEQVNELKKLYSKFKIPILYSSGALTKSLAQLIVGFVIAKYITPYDLGLWTTINLLLTYSVFLQAGFINGLNLELPLASGKGDDVEVRLLAGSVQSIVIVFSILFLILGSLYFLFYPEQNLKIKYGVVAIVFVCILTYYQSYLMSTFRSKNSFETLSFIQIADSLINIGTLVFIVYFTYYGMILKSVIVILIYVILLHIYRPIKVNIIWDNKSIIKLLKVGIPIFALAIIESFSSTLDKVWLIKFSNSNDLGFYSFGLYGYTVFLLFSASIASYVYPRMSYSFGKQGDVMQIWRFVKKVTLILLGIQLPIAIIGFLFIPSLITYFFSNYIQSTAVMQILLFAGIFKGSLVGVNALWSMKKWKLMISYQLFSSSIFVCSTYIGAYYFLNKIEGVAYGILIANILSFLFGIALVFLTTKTQSSANTCV
jgi:O-antigen/teichoic acid export membrane protein